MLNILFKCKSVSFRPNRQHSREMQNGYIERLIGKSERRKTLRRSRSRCENIYTKSENYVAV
jgi:uncharacterized protein YcfJ